MKKIPADKVKERTKQASEIFASQFPYSNKLGKWVSTHFTKILNTLTPYSKVLEKFILSANTTYKALLYIISDGSRLDF